MENQYRQRQEKMISDKNILKHTVKNTLFI